MSEGLMDFLGLGEKNESTEPASDAQQQGRSAFDDALSTVNESLQSAITSATPEEHEALNADRDKVIEAYQVASSRYGEDDSAGQAAMDRVLAAASTLGGKAAQAAEAAAAAQQEWGAKEEQLDEMSLHVNELADAGHPKSEKLQQLTETIRQKAHGHDYGDSMAAVEELQPKLDAIMAEHQAMIAEAEAAGAAAEQADEGSWWDQARQAADDAYEWATGDDEEGDAVDQESAVAQYGPDEEEGEELSATEDEDTNEEDSDEEDSSSSDSDGEHGWDALSEAEQHAWSVLGWDRGRWESNNPPASASKSWDKLSAAEQSAAQTLGYKPDSWNREVEVYPDNGWYDLASAEQAAWTVLGWSAELWESKQKPPSSYKTWEELSPSERAAADSLGYSENTWNADDDSGAGAGALPVVGYSYRFPVEKSLSYLTVDAIVVSGKFAPKSDAAREYMGSKEGFDAEAKAELKTKLDGSFGFDEASGALAISSSGAKGAVAVNGKKEITRGLNATWEVEINVFEVEGYDSTKKQHGKRIGPLVITPPSIVPKGGIALDTTIANIPGALSGSVAIVITPNYDKIALEVGKVLGVRVLQGLGGLAFGIIEAGYQTIAINYKHIIVKTNPYGLTKIRDQMVQTALQGYEAGLRNSPSTGGIMPDLYNQAAGIGSQKHFDVRARLEAEGKLTLDLRKGGDLFAQEEAIVNQAIEEAIANGALAGASVKFEVQAVWACWHKFNADYPDTSNADHMHAIEALWGDIRNAPNSVRRKANLPPLETNAE